MSTGKTTGASGNAELAIGDAARHEKWVYAQLSDDDITMLVLLYLCQERIIELSPEGAQFLQRYFRKYWRKLVIIFDNFRRTHTSNGPQRQ